MLRNGLVMTRDGLEKHGASSKGDYTDYTDSYTEESKGAFKLGFGRRH